MCALGDISTEYSRYIQSVLCTGYATGRSALMIIIIIIHIKIIYLSIITQTNYMIPNILCTRGVQIRINLVSECKVPKNHEWEGLVILPGFTKLPIKKFLRCNQLTLV